MEDLAKFESENIGKSKKQLIQELLKEFKKTNYYYNCVNECKINKHSIKSIINNFRKDLFTLETKEIIEIYYEICQFFKFCELH